MILFSSLNLVIFLLISLLHVYWAFGGKWALEGAIPQTKGKGSTIAFEPGPIATLIVAVGLLLFALVHANALGLISLLEVNYLNIALIFIAAIFALRAVGDFNYVGLFKKQKEGIFAICDTRYYIPLCLLISFNAWLTYFLL